MNKTDLLEIKKLFKYPDASFEGMEYCEVRSCEYEGEQFDDRMLFTGSSKFLTREDEEQKAFLSLLSKAFSFSQSVSALDVAVPGELKKLFLSFTGGSNASITTDVLARTILSKYPQIGPYSMILFRGSYDIPIKDESKTKTGESEDVYNYFALMLCPVKAERSGLSPDLSSENIVKSAPVSKLQSPTFGLIYPSFTDRAADTDTCFVCAKSLDERTLINELFRAEVEAPPKKEKAVIKEDVIPDFELPDEGTEKINELYSDLKSGNVESLKESIKKLDDYFNGNERVNSIDAALLDKRAENEGDDEPAQDIEVKEDKSSVSLDRITERDINGRRYFIIPKELLPEDVLERLLSL